MKTQDNCTGSAVARLYRTLGPADINYSGVARYESSIDGGTACAGQVRVVDGQFEISNLAVVGDDIDYIRPPAGRLKIVMEDDAEIELDYDPMKRDHDFGGVNFCPLCV